MKARDGSPESGPEDPDPGASATVPIKQENETGLEAARTGILDSGSPLRAVMFRGPIPDPETLAGYGQLDPTFPGRILAMAESQLAHRQAEARTLREDVARENLRLLGQGDRGQRYALIVVLAVLLLAGSALVLGHPGTAAIIVTVDITTVASLFILGGRGGGGSTAGPSADRQGPGGPAQEDDPTSRPD
jgi:uncharacterized membrane protein